MWLKLCIAPGGKLHCIQPHSKKIKISLRELSKNTTRKRDSIWMTGCSHCEKPAELLNNPTDKHWAAKKTTVEKQPSYLKSATQGRWRARSTQSHRESAAWRSGKDQAKLRALATARTCTAVANEGAEVCTKRPGLCVPADETGCTFAQSRTAPVPSGAAAFELTTSSLRRLLGAGKARRDSGAVPGRDTALSPTTHGKASYVRHHNEKPGSFRLSKCQN